MKESEKPKNVTKAIILKTIDFTRLKGTFEEKICFSLNGIERNNNFNEKHDYLKPLILLAYKHIF